MRMVQKVRMAMGIPQVGRPLTAHRAEGTLHGQEGVGGSDTRKCLQQMRDHTCILHRACADRRVRGQPSTRQLRQS